MAVGPTTVEVKENSVFWRIQSWSRRRKMQQLQKSPSGLEGSAYKTIHRSGSTLMLALHNWRDKKGGGRKWCVFLRSYSWI